MVTSILLFTCLLLYVGKSLFSCNSSSCEIPDDWVNDRFCDCPQCDDESYLNCDICQCPTQCGDYYLCLTSGNNVTFEYEYDTDVYQSFLYDCKIGSQEGLLLSLEIFCFVICCCLVIFFCTKICKKTNKNHLSMRFKILVLTCNILYLFVTFLSFAVSYTWLLLGCQDYISGETYLTVLYLWRNISYFVYILTYLNFCQRFIYSLKDSLFELTKMKYFLYFCNVMLFLIFFWVFIDASILYVISIKAQSDPSVYEDEFAVNHESYRHFFYHFRINLVQRTYIAASIIAMVLFIYKFRQVVIFTSSSDLRVTPSVPNVTSHGKHGEKLVSVVSRTTVLMTFALSSTVLLLIASMIVYQVFNGATEFFSYYINVGVGIDSSINVLCLNLQYPYSAAFYQRLKCDKIQKTARRCILWCYYEEDKLSSCKCTCTPGMATAAVLCCKAARSGSENQEPKNGITVAVSSTSQCMSK